VATANKRRSESQTVPLVLRLSGERIILAKPKFWIPTISVPYPYHLFSATKSRRKTFLNHGSKQFPQRPLSNRKEETGMDQQLLEVLERIASALEKISESLSSKAVNARHDKTVSGFRPVFVGESSSGTDTKSNNDRRAIIYEFLSSRNIRVKHVAPEDEADKVLDSIAIFMGDRYSLIKPFYEQLKAKMNSGDTIRMDLKERTQQEISNICQLATWLHEIAFLKDYVYRKSPKYLLFAVPNKIPKAMNFLAGGWLERFVKAKVKSLIEQLDPPLEFSFLSNVQIQLPNGNDFELDHLLEVNRDIYWFEAKTGDYQRYVQRYSTFSKILGLEKDHAFLILTDITDAGAMALETLFNMKVVRIDNFSTALIDCLKKSQPRHQETPSQDTVK